MDEVRILESLGLSDKEARVYLALLELGTASAQTVSTKSYIKKPTTYLALEELRKKGLLTKLPKAKRVLYRANSPYELESIINEQALHARRLLPSLSARFKETSRVQMTFYEGASGMRSAYMHNINALKGSTEYAFYGIAENISKETLKIIDDWRDTNSELGIKTVAVAPEHPSLKNYRQEDTDLLVKTTTVPFSDYSSRISVEALDGMVRIMLLESDQAIIIEDKAVAEAFQQIFKLALRGVAKRI